ncbi:MAG: hypothetical protein QXW86_07310 [Saccharolobus sp.]|uniref:hypothetical protein n=1 Tax=Saccharolobus sp. TaxID=2100761 RepID=UPI0031774C25
MGKKGLKKKKMRKRYPKTLIIVLAVMFSIIISGTVYYLSVVSSPQSSQNKPTVLKAIIIDGLSEDAPNPKLISEMRRILESAGYTVTIFNGSNVNIELFKKLPTTSSSLIIMRLHGGRIQQPIGLFIGSGIFAEPFDENKYKYEYLSGYFLKGVAYIGGKEYFVITPHYVSEKFEGKFPNSIVVVLSCYSMWDQVLASAFIEKGASAFIGIDHKADINYLDKVGLELVKLLSQKIDVEEAVSRVLEDIGPDPTTGAKILSYTKK